MKRFAIGWCLADCPCPEDVHKTDVGPLAILSVSECQASAPRQRLHHQISCFDLGLDLLPIAPRAVLTEQDAVEGAVAQASHIMEHIERLAGLGQLTLLLSGSEIVAERPTRGNSWLRRRQAERRKAEETVQKMERAVLRLISNSGLPSRILHHPKRGTVQCHLLVQRTEAAGIRAGIAAEAQTLPAETGLLQVTGLWPPYAFSQLPEPQADRAVA